MQAFSHDGRNYTPLLDQLALYFQIRDDLINLSSPEYMKGKSFCEDLTVRQKCLCALAVSTEIPRVVLTGIPHIVFWYSAKVFSPKHDTGGHDP